MASVLDFALGLCPFPLLAADNTLATTNLNVSFLRPALPGVAIVRASADRLGRTVGFTHGAMHDSAGKLVATGTATLSVFPEPT
ncbi:PaaI family thioesterase [Actibacterium sp. D379-3]